MEMYEGTGELLSPAPILSKHISKTQSLLEAFSDSLKKPWHLEGSQFCIMFLDLNTSLSWESYFSNPSLCDQNLTLKEVFYLFLFSRAGWKMI